MATNEDCRNSECNTSPSLTSTSSSDCQKSNCCDPRDCTIPCPCCEPHYPKPQYQHRPPPQNYPRGPSSRMNWGGKMGPPLPSGLDPNLLYIVSGKWNTYFNIDRFSACGGIRTDFKSVSTAILSRAGLGHIGKERIARDATTRRLPYQAKGLFCPGWVSLHRFTAYLWQCSMATFWSWLVSAGQETKHLCVSGKIGVEAAWPKPIQPASFFQV